MEYDWSMTGVLMEYVYLRVPTLAGIRTCDAPDASQKAHGTWR